MSPIVQRMPRVWLINSLLCPRKKEKKNEKKLIRIQTVNYFYEVFDGFFFNWIHLYSLDRTRLPTNVEINGKEKNEFLKCSRSTQLRY